MERVPEIGAMDSPEEVESYDQLSKRFLGLVEKKFIRRSLKLLTDKSVLKKSLILDVGTGTANIPLLLISEFSMAGVVAVDLSLNMLKKARSNIEEKGLENRIFLVNADAEQLPFRSESFALVISHSTIHHLPGPLQAVTETVRVTRKGCRFIIRDLRRPPSYLLELYVQIFGLPYDRLMKKMYRESLRAGYSYKEMKSLSRKISGTVIKARRFFITHVGLEGTRCDSDIFVGQDH